MDVMQAAYRIYIIQSSRFRLSSSGEGLSCSRRLWYIVILWNSVLIVHGWSVIAVVVLDRLSDKHIYSVRTLLEWIRLDAVEWSQHVLSIDGPVVIWHVVGSKTLVVGRRIIHALVLRYIIRSVIVWEWWDLFCMVLLALVLRWIQRPLQLWRILHHFRLWRCGGLYLLLRRPGVLDFRLWWILQNFLRRCWAVLFLLRFRGYYGRNRNRICAECSHAGGNVNILAGDISRIDRRNHDWRDNTL